MESSMFNKSRTDFVDPVSDHTKYMFTIVVLFGLCESVCALGIAGNIANIIVFTKQGFKKSINISLLGLAVADLACVATQFWTSFCDNPLLSSPDMHFCTFHLVYYTTAWSHVCFNRITSFITAFITLERCLCITLPLKIKNILNSDRTTVIIVSIFIVMFIAFSPFYYVNGLEWVFNPQWNRSVITLVYTEEKVLVETVTFLIHSVAMPAISLVTVVACTIILIVQLKKKTKWREMSLAGSMPKTKTSSSSSSSMRDMKVVKMVTFIAVIFIVCFIPGAVNFLLMAFNPEFSVTGKYQNMFFAVWDLTILVESVSSSVNIFIYIGMSSKFKVTFINTFCIYLK